MARRYRLSKRYSKRLFTRTAKKHHSKNMRPVVMRGGIRF